MYSRKIYNGIGHSCAVEPQVLLTFGVTLFSIIDSVGNVPFFVAATESFRAETRRWVIQRASIIAAGVLVFFLLFGDSLLGLFNLRLSSFQIAAGIVLFIIGWDLLRARTSATKTSEAEEAETLAREDIAVFPLAIPLLSGPGAITTCIVYGSGSHGAVDKAMLVLVVVAAMLLSFLVLLMGSRLLAKIGLTGMRVIRRIMGLLLTAIAVNFVVEGIKGTLPYIAA